MITSLKIRVYGEVQNVGLRYESKMKADRLGISGFVRNEPDGSVYLEVQGEEDAIRQFLIWCRKGPAYAKIDRVETTEAKILPYSSFDIKL